MPSADYNFSYLMFHKVVTVTYAKYISSNLLPLRFSIKVRHTPKHDVIGLYTLLPMDSIGAGKLKVKARSDGSECKLTWGHKQKPPDNEAYNEEENSPKESPDAKGGEAAGGEEGAEKKAEEERRKEEENATDKKERQRGVGDKDAESKPDGGAAGDDSHKSNEPQSVDAASKGNAYNSLGVRIYDNIVAAMRDQVVGVDVEPVGCSLGIFKSPVRSYASRNVGHICVQCSCMLCACSLYFRTA
eukprot:6206789-Pleurochrysis_carterae.AAC.6